MPRYLLQSTYTPEGIKGLMKDGGSARMKIVSEAVKSVEGKVEAFYFAFGDTDTFTIVDVPDATAAAAMSLTVCASGAVRTKTTVLLTPEEMDRATKKSVRYTPPGR